MMKNNCDVMKLTVKWHCSKSTVKTISPRRYRLIFHRRYLLLNTVLDDKEDYMPCEMDEEIETKDTSSCDRKESFEDLYVQGSGPEQYLYNKMWVSLNKEQLSCLLEQLQDKGDSIIIRGEIKSQLEGITTNYDFVVDNWPDFRAIVGRINPVQTKEIDLPVYFEHRVVVYCTDDEALVSLLLQPGVLDWTKRHSFLFPKKSTGSVIAEGIPGRTIGFGDDLHLMIVGRHTLKLMPLPEGFTILPIQQEQAALVNSTWKFNKGRHSELYILNVIAKLPSCCLYDREGKVVGFALQYHYGALGMLFVHEEYRGKGYAKVITSHLAKACLDREREVFTLLENSNRASISLHESVGFEDYGVTHVAVKTEM